MSKLAQLSPAIWVKENNLVNEKGEIIDFKDHLFLWQIYADMNPEQVIKKCLAPETRVLTSDLRWVLLENVEVGQDLVSVDDLTGGKARGRKIRKTTITGKCETYEEAYCLTMSDGRKIIATGDHRFLCNRNIDGRIGPTKWKYVKDIKIGENFRNFTNLWSEGNFDDGWFGGFIDGEGSLRKRNEGGTEMSMVQVDNNVLQKALKYLKDNNIPYSLSEKNKSDLGKKLVFAIRICSQRHLFSIVGKCRPSRFVFNSAWWEGLSLSHKSKIDKINDTWIKVVKKEMVGKRRMIDISTTTGTFIAEGFISHNCAQVGVSVTMNLKVFHLAKYRGITTIYTMPSDSDVWEFVKTKTDKIYSSNPELKKNLVSDNIGLKQVGNNFIYYKGTVSKTASISTTADLLLHDELDRSELSIVEQYRSRISASKYKGIWKISNPSISGVGVDEDWKRSDKKEWFITCKGCGEEQYLIWEDNVDEIKGVYVCSHCGKELTDIERMAGIWKPTGTGRISGYHISQMMASWLTAKDLIKEKEERGIEYFNNFVLGEPYSVGEMMDFRRIIEDCWTDKTIDEEPFYMGIDIGKVKHYVLGTSKGIFKIGKCESREELEDIIKRYNPRWVMDSGPERTWAEEFKSKYPKGTLCFLNKKSEDKPIAEWGGQNNTDVDRKRVGYVYVDRNRAIDQMIYEMARGEMLFSVDSRTLGLYINHWLTMRRIIEESGQNKRYVWTSTNGEDHWCFATLFYWLAKQRGQKSTFIQDVLPKKEIIQATADGFEMRSLEDIINEQNL